MDDHNGKTREEHLEWCKTRAREYLDRRDYMNAVTSMLSDLAKHTETRPVADAMGPIGMKVIIDANHEDVRRFIEGFN